MPLPYMWSKNKSASKICNIIKLYTKDSDKILIDLFCGWFAIWEEFVKNWYKVIANDKNKYVIALLDQVINKWLDEAKCLERVSRELFIDVINNPNKYDNWYVWYVMCIWSFWNNQRHYLFWKDIEHKKQSLYELVVNKKVDKFVKDNIPQKYIDWLFTLDGWHKRRLWLKKILNVLWNRIDMDQLQRLESLERLENIDFTSQSYEDVYIPSNAIVYCDPPYKWTATYAEWWFDHNKFRQHIRQLSKTNKVFISEYNAPDDFKCIYEFSQKSTLWWWNQTHNNQPNEKLFVCNG